MEVSSVIDYSESYYLVFRARRPLSCEMSIKCSASIESKVQPKNLLFFSFFFLLPFVLGPGCLGFVGAGPAVASWRKKKGSLGPTLLYIFYTNIPCGLNKYQTYWRRQNRMYSIFHSLPSYNLQLQGESISSHPIFCLYFLYLYFKFFLFLSYSKVWS